MDEIGSRAIKRAIRALRKRHLLEEGAHAPAFHALARPWAVQVLFLEAPLDDGILKFFALHPYN